MRKCLWYCVFLLSLCAASSQAACATMPAGSWSGYTIHKRVKLGSACGATYYQLNTANGSTAHVVAVDTRCGNWALKPVFTRLASTANTAQRHGATAAINAGFFAFGSGASIGYIMTDFKVVTDPSKSSVVTGNSNLAGYASAVLNRSEVRFLTGAGGSSVQVAAHNDPLPSGTTAKHVLQAGPQLLPQLTSRKEAFIRGSYDAIQCNSRAPRTAIGITPQGMFLMVCVEGRSRRSPGVTLAALADFLRDLGCTQGLNFDGGGSTTMYLRPSPTAAGTLVCTATPQRPVASVLLLEEVLPQVLPTPAPQVLGRSSRVAGEQLVLPVTRDLSTMPSGISGGSTSVRARRFHSAGMHSQKTQELLQQLRLRVHGY